MSLGAARAALFFSAAWLAGCFSTQGEADDPHAGGREDGAVDRDEDAGAAVNCGAVGRSVACVGPGGCAGGQVCRADGSFDVCDCGATPADAGSVPVDGAVAMPLPEPPACGVGATCARPSDCEPGFACIQELYVSIAAKGLPDGGNRLMLTAFPGGVCSPGPLMAWDDPRACDPFAPDGQQGCGGCGRCGGMSFESGLVLACLEPCTPSPTASGCSRAGYTCDLTTRACMHGCTSDVECKIARLDTNGDGLGDMSSYDPDSGGTCDPATSRCTRPGIAGAEAGDPCSVDDDCEADGFCFSADRIFAGQPYAGGYCSKSGCNHEGFACAGDGVCTELRSWDAFPNLGFTCHASCTQGAEAEELKLGPGGHGDQCREGYMCLWRGESSDPSGVCAPGNYNDVAVPNLGQPCRASSQCYSPQGHGSCLSAGEGASFCTVMDCDAPGLPRDVCGEQGACVLFADKLRTGCMLRCTDASECPGSLGCSRATGPLPAQSVGVCAPCASDAECLAEQTCERGLCR